ncbi:alpha/beta hydrolase-fold protein [Aureisphaera galaxeae]|uniref:alpha/beta hydrolase n=1 Tax=Aureisphaera galaxeae TaxID=1538023 RepID=UPI002350D838|nr:alpha/beta hydrolase-fold protein [Aureisphaera galaxeae]MDC8002481.1 alpha/beta hydrolase-fold protein [Aureisphaera galaxeae]
MKRKQKLIAILTLFLAISTAWAQRTSQKSFIKTPSKTEVRMFQSKANGINYKLSFHTPPNYTLDMNKTYPVLFLLDGDDLFSKVKSVSTDEMILIGIGYADTSSKEVDQTRDYTPTYVPYGGFSKEAQKHSGKAKKFLEYIAKELIPYVKENFRTNDNLSIAGQAFGGLFTSWVMIRHPEIFDNYIIVNPSLWYNNHYIVRFLDHIHVMDHIRYDDNSENKKVYLSVTNNDLNPERNHVGDLEVFVSKLKAIPLDIKCETLEHTKDGTNFSETLEKGLSFIYKK